MVDFLFAIYIMVLAFETRKTKATTTGNAPSILSSLVEFS